jgi:hypothetical protein
MNPTRTSGPAAEAKQLLLRVIPRVVLGAAMAVATFGVSPASASLTGEVVGAAGSVVKTVAAPAAPSLPSAKEPLPPPPPAPPPVSPSPPPPPAPDPVPTVAGGAKKVVDSVVDVVAHGDAAGASKKAITEAPGASKEADKPVLPSAPDSGASAQLGGAGARLGDDARAPSAKAGAAENDAQVPGTAPRRLAAGGAPPSIRSAREAPLRRWLARVWPAIALAGDSPASARLGDALALTVVDITRLLLSGTVRADAGGVLGAAENANAANASRTGPVGIPLPGGREITLFVIFSFVALLALLLSTVWVEVRSKYLYR